jgi:acyl-CoA synthetase (AMP-forming)/AMP-acid ligase II
MLLASLDYPQRPVTVLCTTHTTIVAMQMIPTLLLGGTVVTRPTFDLEPMLLAARAERANVLFLPTQLLYVLLGRDDTAWLRGQVELFFYGGESMTAPRLRDLIARFGRVFAQAYGAMEAGPAAVLRPQDHDPEDPDVLGSMGRPLHGTVIDVLAPDGAVLPANEIGRIAIRSPAAMLGYVGLAEKTRETIVDGAVLNGDIGFRDNRGFVHLADRSAFAIERDGRTFYPREIEGRIAEHPSVRTAVVMQIEGANGHRLLCAAVLLGADAAPSPAELNEHLAARMDGLRLDGILTLRELPLNAVSGKADRVQLKALLQREFAPTT